MKDDDGRTFKWHKITEGLWEKVYIKVKKKKKKTVEDRPIFRGLGSSNKTNRGPLGYMI